MIQPMNAGLRQIQPVALGLLLASACTQETPLDPVALAFAPPTQLTATAVSHERIDLVWQDNVRNELGWEVHRSTTGPSGPFSVVLTTYGSTTATNDTGLQELTEYCYMVRSIRLAGQRRHYGEFSNVACATTREVPIPPAPADLTATPNCCNYIYLTWTDNSVVETGFRVERASSNSGPWTSLGVTGSNYTSYANWVSPEQSFCYRVIAFNNFGESDPSNVDCTAVPAAPTGLTAAVSGRDVQLGWTDNSGMEDGFQVRRAIQGQSASVIATLPPNTTSYRDPGLVDNTYQYHVVATKDGGTSGATNFVLAIVASAPPAAPSGLYALPQGSTIIFVGWNDGSTNEAGFRVERSLDDGATWTLATTVGAGGTAAADPGRSPETRVCYRAVAFNSVGDSPPSNIDCTTPPAAPTNLIATGIGPETIDFAWTDKSAVEDGYELWGCYYYYYYYCWWSPLVTFEPNTTSYRYQDWSAYGYSYAVVARKDGGSSDLSNIVYPVPPSSSASGDRRP